MPLYQYICHRCGEVDEHFRDTEYRNDPDVHYDDDAPVTCWGKVTRVLTPAHLLGSPNMSNG